MAYETDKLPKKLYKKELEKLQIELVRMVDWVQREGARVAIVFEGRDAAGKGGVIKRIVQHVSPRVVRTVALPAPTDKESTQWYFQRYVAELPAAGEVVLFDRSWYNRAGVEKVMGFCTAEEHQRFLRQCPTFERMLVDDGITLIKYWFSVDEEEQEKRFKSRIDDPLKQWKLSDIDLYGRSRWVDYSRAKDEMFVHTDIPEARWHVVESDDQEERPDQLHQPPARPDPLRVREAQEGQAAEEAGRRGLRAPARGSVRLRPRRRRRAARGLISR